MMTRGQTSVPVELVFDSATANSDTELNVVFAGGGSEWRVPAFHAGGTMFKVRFSAPVPGQYTYRAVCSADPGLDGKAGEFQIDPYTGENYLYRHGPLRVAENHRTLEHADGTPFFWLGDTWWMGLTKRLDWPDGFASLAADRVAKGFNLIQIVAGPLPDFDAEDAVWNPQQTNECGWPWERDWAQLNPEYYNLADLRIKYLVDQGLVPCIVGMWGFYLPFMGIDRARQHWRNLVARYGAYPVVWCVAGEVKMPTYSHHGTQGASETECEELARGWTEVARYLRTIDPYHHPVTAHPTGNQSARNMLLDESLIDIDMLQTCHGGHAILPQTVDAVDAANARRPRMPVVNGEPCYEGIMGTAWHEMQRFVFWTSVMSGSAGHTYGAQGIWAMSSRDEPFVGSTMNWGEGFWQDVMHYPGSAQVGLGRRFLERYAWWLFEPQPDRLAVVIPGKVKVFYLTGQWVDPRFVGMRDKRIEIEPGTRYRAYFFDPRTGADVIVGPVEPDADGTWPVPRKPTMDDWVLVLENT